MKKEKKPNKNSIKYLKSVSKQRVSTPNKAGRFGAKLHNLYGFVMLTLIASYLTYIIYSMFAKEMSDISTYFFVNWFVDITESETSGVWWSVGALALMFIIFNISFNKTKKYRLSDGKKYKGTTVFFTIITLNIISLVTIFLAEMSTSTFKPAEAKKQGPKLTAQNAIQTQQIPVQYIQQPVMQQPVLVSQQDPRVIYVSAPAPQQVVTYVDQNGKPINPK